MTAAQLYKELKERITGDMLHLRRGMAEGKLDSIFRAFHTEMLCLRACTVEQEKEQVTLAAASALTALRLWAHLKCL